MTLYTYTYCIVIILSYGLATKHLRNHITRIRTWYTSRYIVRNETIAQPRFVYGVGLNLKKSFTAQMSTNFQIEYIWSSDEHFNNKFHNFIFKWLINITGKKCDWFKYTMVVFNIRYIFTKNAGINKYNHVTVIIVLFESGWKIKMICEAGNFANCITIKLHTW